MMSAMMIAGAIAVLAGLGAVALGIPVKEFSFGNTMILSGTIGVCTGLLLFGLSAVLAELRTLSQRLRLRLAEEPSSQALNLPADNDERREPLSMPATASAPVEDTRREGGFLRSRARPLEPEPPLPEPEAGPSLADREPSQRSKRNLFSESMSRRERERGDRRDTLTPDLRSPPMSEPPAIEPVQPPSFDETWPRPERDRGRASEPPPLLRRPPRAAPASPEPEPPRDDAPEVTLVKSGVVDGMAYSLYSDGSIEAQMPEGMMRFNSIAELRTHLDQRG